MAGGWPAHTPAAPSCRGQRKRLGLGASEVPAATLPSVSTRSSWPRRRDPGAGSGRRGRARLPGFAVPDQARRLATPPVTAGVGRSWLSRSSVRLASTFVSSEGVDRRVRQVSGTAGPRPFGRRKAGTRIGNSIGNSSETLIRPQKMAAKLRSKFTDSLRGTRWQAVCQGCTFYGGNPIRLCRVKDVQFSAPCRYPRPNSLVHDQQTIEFQRSICGDRTSGLTVRPLAWVDIHLEWTVRPTSSARAFGSAMLPTDLSTPHWRAGGFCSACGTVPGLAKIPSNTSILELQNLAGMTGGFGKAWRPPACTRW